MAESWEFSPDGLKITMKLRQGVKWHNKAPVNGRAVDVDDIIQTGTASSGNGARVETCRQLSQPGRRRCLSMTATDAARSSSSSRSR